MTAEELDAVIQQIDSNECTSLILIDNKIRDDQIITIAKALQNNTSLTEIRLTSNQISHKGAIALAAALEQNITLTSLYLDVNQIGDEGFKAFAKTLQHNTTLTTLQLMDWGVQISDESARAMAAALKINTTLTSLYIDYSDMNIEIVKRIENFLERNKEIDEKKQIQIDLYTQERMFFDWIGNPSGRQPVPQKMFTGTYPFLLERNNAAFFKAFPAPDSLLQSLPLDVLHTQLKLQQSIHLQIVKTGK